MPLIKSPSKDAVGKNIKAEEAAGRPHKQAVAIALDVQRRAGGGSSPPKSTPRKAKP
jgi:hypothetical protein